MSLMVALDPFERRHLRCVHCAKFNMKNKKDSVLREVSHKKSPFLECTVCLKRWAEKDIRQGVARGLTFIA